MAAPPRSSQLQFDPHANTISRQATQPERRFIELFVQDLFSVVRPYAGNARPHYILKLYAADIIITTGSPHAVLLTPFNGDRFARRLMSAPTVRSGLQTEFNMRIENFKDLIDFSLNSERIWHRGTCYSGYCVCNSRLKKINSLTIIRYSNQIITSFVYYLVLYLDIFNRNTSP